MMQASSLQIAQSIVGRLETACLKESAVVDGYDQYPLVPADKALSPLEINTIKSRINREVAVTRVRCGWTLVGIAARCNQVDLLRWLITLGGGIYNVNDWGESALFTAALAEAVEVVEFLLSSEGGADVRVVMLDNNSSTTQHHHHQHEPKAMSSYICERYDRRLKMLEQSENDEERLLYPIVSYERILKLLHERENKQGLHRTVMSPSSSHQQ